MSWHVDTEHRRWVVATGATALALVTVSAASAIAIGWDWQDYVSSYTLTNTAIGLALAGSGVMIGWFRPRNAVGPLFAAAGIAHLVTATLAPLTSFGIAQDWPVPLTRLMAGVFLGAWGFGLPTLALLALILFPDGRLPGRRWRPVVWYFIGTGVVGFVLSMVNPFDIIAGEPASRPLFAVEGIPMAELESAFGILGLPSILFVIASLVVRYVRGDERTRRQLLWLILAFLCMLVINLQRFITGDGPILLLLSIVLIPGAIAIAIIRYQLLDIRVVLSRTLLYGVLIALIIALYAGIVASFTLVVPPDADRAVAVGAAVTVAMLFAPLRLLLQRVAGRALFGTRDDPARTIATAQAATGLTGLLREVRRSLRLPQLALTHAPGTALIDGEAPEHPVHETLAVPGGAELTVTLRPGERRLHDADRRALALIIPAIATVLRERSLIEEVRAARALTVETRERERHLLHRDLHDGLGPTLTGAAMRIDAAANLVDIDPIAARENLVLARRDVGSAVDDVRRVVYGLRPLALADSGLADALRQESGGIPEVVVEAPSLPPLSPAVELAAYRIAMEAITNARRHSNATTVSVRLTAEDGVLITTIADNGNPPEAYTPGTGIHSMQLRAEELGGNTTAGPIDQGWQIIARLPLVPTAAAPTPEADPPDRA